MPIQTLEPMTKDFPTFDCDAHVTEPPLIWKRAGEFLTREEMEALRATIWWDDASQQLIVDGKAGVGIGSPRHPGDDAGDLERGAGREARHPARAQRAQPRPEDRAHAGAGLVPRLRGL